MKQNHIKRFKRFRNPPGGPRRRFSLYKRFFFFVRRLFDAPDAFPETFVVPHHKALKMYHEMLDENTITWLGHSTFLIKLNGKTILTDPFLTEYASPIHGFGPRRYSPPGIPISHLPKIDIIVISHDHYDHCDARTLKQLPNKEEIDVVVPLRLGKLIKKFGYKKIHELGWHEEWKHEHISIRALPAYHYSKRTLIASNLSLWASFAIKGGGKKLYFTGDTAYGSMFTELGKEYGPFDYALLSIGAYDPPAFMQTGHLSPEHAVQLGQDMQAKTLVAMHWGTIILSDEPQLEPPLRFYHAAQIAEFAYYQIWILNVGETRKL